VLDQLDATNGDLLLISIISTCFRHLYAHRQENRLRSTAYVGIEKTLHLAFLIFVWPPIISIDGKERSQLDATITVFYSSSSYKALQPM